jgi:hypothetical protein
MSDATSISLHEEAAIHARMSVQAGKLSWAHSKAEYTQDVDLILATLEPGGPYTWTLPNNKFLPSAAELEYSSLTTLEEIRQIYVDMRKYVEVLNWEATTEIRAGWYTMTHGVSKLRDVVADEFLELESITMFPVGKHGILGEVQIGDLGVARENRWPESPAFDGDVPLPRKRQEVLGLHNAFLQALRNEDVPGILATMRPDVATAIRSYLTDEYVVLSAGPDELAAYYEALFTRFKIHDVQIVNRIAESWFLFSETHWVVEHRSGERAGQVVEFCTADMAPIDPNGKFWVRTGAGTDPVHLD